MIGLPGCGKSTFARRKYTSYRIISLDNIPNHSRKKEQQEIEENLMKGKSIVIADTNATKKIRAEHINLAKKYGASVIGIFFDYPVHYVIDQNEKRLTPVHKAGVFKINKILERPRKEEGFDDILIKNLN